MGIASVSGSDADADLIQTVTAYIDNGSVIDLTGDASVLAEARGHAAAIANGFNAGGLAVGLSFSDATWSPNVDAYLGSSVTLKRPALRSSQARP